MYDQTLERSKQYAQGALFIQFLMGFAGCNFSDFSDFS
jgi:hypothetical protein